MSKELLCLSIPGLILLRADGELNPDQIAHLEEHLGTCTPCRTQAKSMGLGEERLLEAQAVLKETIPPAEPRARELIRARILSNHETLPDRLLRYLWPPPAIRVAAVLGLAVLAAIAILTTFRTAGTGSHAQFEPTEQVKEVAGDYLPMEVPLAPVGDPFFDGSQGDEPVRMSLSLAADGQPRNLVLAR